MRSPTDQPSGSAQDIPFTLLRPRLLKHKPRSQVVQCEYAEATGNDRACIVKLFSPRARLAFENELLVYSIEEAQSELASKLWSGLWTTQQYHSFLGGNLPSMLRRPENQVRVLVLSPVPNSIPLSDVDDPLRVTASRAAMKALQRLHRLGIVHGDPSASNVLIDRAGQTATWVDFSTSVLRPTAADISHEWQRAADYFSQFVSTSSCKR